MTILTSKPADDGNGSVINDTKKYDTLHYVRRVFLRHPGGVTGPATTTPNSKNEDTVLAEHCLLLRWINVFHVVVN